MTDKSKCYIHPFGTTYYCLNPINPEYIYFSSFDVHDNYYLYCRQDGSNNPLHREDGPAIEYRESFNKHIAQEYYYYGKRIHCKDNKEFLKIISMKAFL